MRWAWFFIETPGATELTAGDALAGPPGRGHHGSDRVTGAHGSVKMNAVRLKEPNSGGEFERLSMRAVWHPAPVFAPH